MDVHGTIDNQSEVTGTASTDSSSLYYAYIHLDFTWYCMSFHTYMHICILCALHVHAHVLHTFLVPSALFTIVLKKKIHHQARQPQHRNPSCGAGI